MRPRIVSVDDVGAPFLRDGAQLTRTPDVPFPSQCQPVRRQSRSFGAVNEWRAGGRNDQYAITTIVKTHREEQYLPLTASPAASRIHVHNPGEGE